MPGGRKKNSSNDDKWHPHAEIDRQGCLGHGMIEPQRHGDTEEAGKQRGLEADSFESVFQDRYVEVDKEAEGNVAELHVSHQLCCVDGCKLSHRF
jgi:hypothetical protein